MDNPEMKDIKELCSEGERLFKKSETMLKELEEASGFNEGESGLKDELEKHWRQCAEERKKLENLDFVVVVMGTMKAGKSTTINAIVGEELLPNRNTPMTTLPTKIRHNPHVKEISLTLKTAPGLNRFLKECQDAIKKQTKNGESNLDEETLQRMKDVKEADSFKQKYVGTDEIYHFLKTMNDLARVSKNLKIEFPYSDYQSLDSLPLIETRFASLEQEVNETGATFTLVDTPGPNEYGQKNLEKILKDQIANASGIILIADYTQLGSDADAEVVSLVKEFVGGSNKRAWILVNKFDNRDRNSLSREQTISRIAHLFNHESRKLIEDKDIYAVSANKAYLANRMRRARIMAEKLDFAACERTWLDDFGNEAFKIDWDDYKKEWQSAPDWGKIDKGLRKLWESSFFQKPLDDVIANGYANAVSHVVFASGKALELLYGVMLEKANNRVVMLQTNSADLKNGMTKTEAQISKRMIFMVEPERKARRD